MKNLNKYISETQRQDTFNFIDYPNVYMIEDEKKVYMSKKQNDFFIIKGKFIDSSTESDWWYNADGSTTTHTYIENVNPTTKEFTIETRPKPTFLRYLFSNNTALERIDNIYGTENVTHFLNAFSGCTNLIYINLKPFNLQSAKSVNYMFQNCEKLSNINWKYFRITDKCTEMPGLFTGCPFENIKLNAIDTSNCTNLQSLFYNCQNLKSIDLRPLNTSKCEQWSWMFSYCSSLTELDLSPLDTRSAKSMRETFAHLTLTELDVSSLNVSNVTSMVSMFAFDMQLKKIDCSSWDTRSLTGMAGIFSSCYQCESINVNGWNTSACTSMSNVFSWCHVLKELDLTSFDFSKTETIYNMFYDCLDLETIKFGVMDLKNCSNLDGAFGVCIRLKNVTGTIKNIHEDLDLSSCPLTHDSIMVFINGLAHVDETKILSIKTTTYNQLTEGDIAIATSQGWTISAV